MKAESGAQWHVLHVRPRCEKKMAEYCTSQRIACELPLRAETKIYQRRKVTVRKPVFPGYVFVVFEPTERVTVLTSNMIVRILPVPSQAQLIHELDQIKQALAVDPTLDACAAFSQGRRVRIDGGPFQGLEGVVQVVRGQTRVVLNVDMIGRAVAVEADMALLSLLE
jgi:transcription antitermination factor NusG